MTSDSLKVVNKEKYMAFHTVWPCQIVQRKREGGLSELNLQYLNPTMTILSPKQKACVNEIKR